MSRPTKYSNEILESANQYLEDFDADGSVIPSISGLAIRLSVHRDTIYTWSKDENKQEFSDTLERVVSKQELILLNKGLKGEFNSAIVKLALANHGYSNRKETTLSGPGGGPVEVSSAWEVLPVASNQRGGKRGC